MMDITEQRKTYGLFMSLTKWGIIGTIGLVILMAIFLL
ncbi:aa3-type cytochrome c oxidase subunit IV [Oleomonas cavernae]|uniref:Aa3-type cytochrome c oxidase subunit IV n=1 Tax=Oleomonas cavernae TaxID=2320859 RepID=A0A418WEW6_9PROT|nr:aa3-type cytochrome c oxidase subunit IV [Oleomonas cavernae]RJF88568.1 aa3-type cytochrome c oxidase subunit IV [Oleomonas cavernae]